MNTVVETDLDDDLHDIIGNDCAVGENYCGQRYWVWEDEVATPLLNEKGWTVDYWFTQEGDSFGPLIRAVKCTNGEITKTFYYG